MSEKNCIFPKINEALIKQLKLQQQHQMKKQIVRKLNAKTINFLYSILDQQPKNKIQFSNIKLISDLRKRKIRKKPIMKSESTVNRQNSSCNYDKNGHMNRNEYSINQILSNRRLQSNSTPVKKVINQMKLQQYVQINKIKDVNKLFRPFSLQKSYRLNNRKCYTQQTEIYSFEDQLLGKLQSCKQQKEMESLISKKLELHDYNSINQEKYSIMSKRIVRKSFFDRKKLKKLQENCLKVTSGWQISKDDLEYL